MKKTFLIILFFITLFGFSKAQNNSLNYMLKGEVGSKTVLELSFGNTKGKQIIKILEKEEKGDTCVVKYESVTTGLGTVKYTYTVKSYNDTSYIELKDYLNVANFVDIGVTTINPMWLSFPAQFQATEQELMGYYMVRDYDSYQITTDMINRKMVEHDTITTPAGVFSCVKITYTIEAKTNYGTFISNYVEWFNKDLGLIKQESYTKSGRLENSSILISTDIKTSLR